MPASSRLLSDELVCNRALVEGDARECAGEAQERAEAALCNEVRHISKRHVRRLMADTLRGWRRCELKACRRARRCRTALSQCVGVRHNAWPLDDELRAIDDVYAALLAWRIEQAQEAAE